MEFNEGIVFLDDEIDITQILLSIFQEAKILAWCANNVEEAKHLLATHPVFLLLIDYRLTLTTTGLSFFEEIKHLYPNLQAVMITGWADKNNVMEALRLGIKEVIEKPFDNKRLVELVQRFMNERKNLLEADAKAMLTIRDGFIQESRELLEDTDNLVLSLENTAQNNHAAIDNLYRRIHTIKGSSGAIPGTEHVFEVAHKFESLLSKLRSGTFVCSPECVDVIFSAIDALNLLLLEIGAPSEAQSFQSSSLLNALNAFIGVEKKTSIVNEDGIIWASDLPDSPPKTSVPVNNNADCHAIDKGVFVDNKKLDRLMEIAGDLVVLNNNLDSCIMRAFELDVTHGRVVSALNKSLSNIAELFQSEILIVRKVRFEWVMNGFSRIVRNLARDLRKTINFSLEGLDVEMDKTIAKELHSALVHLVRNSCDHGIESAEERVNAGKTIEGKLSIKAENHQGEICITLEDDGRGFNKEAIIKKAIEKGLVLAEKAKELTEQEIQKFIFMPGFSTSKIISDVSGRGVGLDAVSFAVEQLKGKISAHSISNQGTRFVIIIPALRAVVIERLMIFKAEGYAIAIPAVGVKKVLAFTQKEVAPKEAGLELLVDNKLMPLTEFNEILDTKPRLDPWKRRDGIAVVVISGTYSTAIIVDSILEQISAVVRPYSGDYCVIPACKGVALLPENKLAFVLDPELLVQEVKNTRKQRIKALGT